MSKRLINVKRAIILLSLCGTTLGVFGVDFGSGGCNYARFADYQTMLTASGQAVIQGVSDNLLGNVGTDFDTVIRNPATTFARASWANYINYNVPDDLPNEPILKR